MIARRQQAQSATLQIRIFFLRRLELKRVARGGHVAWPTHGHAAEASSGKGYSDLIASASCALQLERVESQKRSPRDLLQLRWLEPKASLR